MNILKTPTFLIVASVVISLGIAGYAFTERGRLHSAVTLPAPSLGFQMSPTVSNNPIHANGVVKASQDVSLAFEMSGRVTSVPAHVGDRVKSGQVLATLAAADFAADLAQATASIKAEQARLAELERGARPVDLTSQRLVIANAEISLRDARNALVDAVQDAYTKTDDAVRSKASQLFSDPESGAAHTFLTISNSQWTTDIDTDRNQLGFSLRAWNTHLSALTPESDPSPFVTEARLHLNRTKMFLETLASVLNDVGTCVHDYSSGCLPVSAGWKSDISLARANINAALSSLTRAEGALHGAVSVLDVAKQGLTVTSYGNTPEQIAAQQARVEAAQAVASGIRARSAKTVLRAPIDGIVTLTDMHVGEVVTPNRTVISVMSSGILQIETTLSEIDVARVSNGAPAHVTLDPYGDSPFAARVIAIDPSATIMNGVSAYKTTLAFITEDARIKPGITANISITPVTQTGR